MKRALQVAGLLLLLAVAAAAQISTDQLGVHDMTPSGPGLVRGSITNACLYCHAPHSALGNPPMWNQQLSMQTYSMYTSSTSHQTGVQPPINSPSKMCLSCHDGTVAPGQTVAYGRVAMSASMPSSSILGTDLRSSHPFSMQTPFTNAPEMNALLFGTPPRTADPKVPLINGNVECTTCHEPHFQNIDKIVQKFLTRDSVNGAMCLACHDPTRVVAGQYNYLSGWGTGVHATATNATSNSPYVGGYGTVAQNACQSCHMPHNATGPARLLRGIDQVACASCHSGTNTTPALTNVFAEFNKIGHTFPSANNAHDRAEPAILNSNRHATCADCHNPHTSQQTATFTVPPQIRPSQLGAVGVSAVDGTTVLNPAVNQFEVCLRCHGTSIGKNTDAKFGYTPNRQVNASDPLNVIPQFAAVPSTNGSSHPVTHDRASTYPQPNLLTQMLQLDGTTPGRAMGVRLFCTDCHNSDDNREFGGTGPNGPHGSKWPHMLERRYEMSQAPARGADVTNLFPDPDLTVNGPYALCGKCHNLSDLLTDPNLHSRHVKTDGFSCSVCHTAHGTSSSPTISGERLVNFDVNVVNGNDVLTPPAYNMGSRSCTLTCHSHVHTGSTY